MTTHKLFLIFSSAREYMVEYHRHGVRYFHFLRHARSAYNTIGSIPSTYLHLSMMQSSRPM